MTVEEVLARHGKAVRSLLRPSVAMRPDPQGSGRSSVGGSRMLARPGERMTLLAQIDLSECAGLVEGVPARGILQASISMQNLPVMGETDLVGGAAHLRILSPDEPLMWIASDDDKPGYAVRFEAVKTSPEFYIEGLADEENDLVTDVYWAEGHRMLGYPSAVQYDVLDTENYNPNRNRVLALQIDGDAALGWHWVDHGVLYFLADGVALARGRVEDALLEMQFR